MIACEICDEWFHGKCVGITRRGSENIENYYCEQCCRIHNKEIVYKNADIVVKTKPVVEDKLLSVKQEQAEATSEPTSIPSPTPAPVPVRQIAATKSPKKPAKRRIPKTKSKPTSAIQCANPDCNKAARSHSDKPSKYCSDQCGYEVNKHRYFSIFMPKYKAIAKNHSVARLNRMTNLEKLDKEKVEVEELIKKLHDQKKDVEEKVKLIKAEAQRLYSETVKDDDPDDNEDAEENLSGDNAKQFCITCGISISRNTQLKHWLTCHRKHEDIFSLAGANQSYYGDEDKESRIYCDAKDKKSGFFCKHLAEACPFHTDWSSGKDEVCGCPLNVMQELVLDGHYCLELKKNCKAHYHWAQFRKAEVDLFKVHAYSRLSSIVNEISQTHEQLSDVYGGVVGVMLHNTTDKRTKTVADKDDQDMEVEVDT